MKIKDNFILREVPGMNVVMPTGVSLRSYRGAIVLNDSATTIYKELEKGADRESIIAALLNKYEIDGATAGADVDATIASLREAGVLE